MMKDGFRMIDTQTTLSLIKAALSSVPSAVDINLPVKEYLTYAKAQQIEAILCVHHRNCAAKPAKLSMDSAEIEQRFRVN